MKKNLLIILLIIFAAIAGPIKAVGTDGLRGFAYQNSPLTLTYQDQTFSVNPKILASWQAPLQVSAKPSINPPQDLQNSLENFFGLPAPAQPTMVTYNFRVDEIYSYVATLAEKINQPAIEPKFTITDNKVSDFASAQNGQSLQTYQSAFNIAEALEKGQTQAELTVLQTTPQKQLADINPYGIKELVAEGVSNFKGSPQNRRHNIAVGVEKMKGTLVAPKATFSFDDNLGPVDGDHGFLPELVIKANSTIPEFGGGLCQVSTTTFRAAMNAGLPIVERRNHAYPVQYYSPQGTDATIYPGAVDLKFVNDTPGYLLIWPYEKDSNTLVFDFYGIKDGREVTLDNPNIYDRQPDGSMKATWTRHITANGQTKTDVFKSAYESPALFHKNTFSIGAEFYVGPPPKKSG